VKYGGDTPCLEIRTQDDEIIIVDTGTGVRNLGNALMKEARNHFHMIFTHAHWDHIIGFPFFKLIYSEETQIDMYGPRHAQASIKDVIATIMRPPYFPVKYGDMSAKIVYHDPGKQKFSIGATEIEPIALSHPNEGFGYKFSENGKCFVYLTDNELTFKHPGGLDYRKYAAFCEGANLLIHDAEFTEKEYEHTKTWGHSVYKDALRLAVDAKAARFGLTHHNQDRNDFGVDELVRDCHRILSKDNISLECFAAYQGMEIRL
jgi:phosphoribosyl 1,2-cyclic phosphodiesterase